ncbi:MAG: hypothetical protein ABH914_02415 [Candidatus Omnitrophota bacterium]
MAVKGNPERIFCEGVRWGSLDKAGFDEAVGYFKKRVEDCFFNPVKKLLLPEYKTTGFVILAVISTLVDLLSQYYYNGLKLKHKEKYKKFLRDHFAEFRESVSLKKFPLVKDFADFFYEGFRCRILHNFMLSEHSTIGWKTKLVQLNVWDKAKGSEEIIVNPGLLLERLENVFIQYMDDLLDKNNSRLRAGFAEKLFVDTGVRIRL